LVLVEAADGIRFFNTKATHFWSLVSRAWARQHRGGLLEKMPSTRFWFLHSALCGVAGLVFLIAGRLFGHLLAPGENENGTSS
jgi:hypothetical protein